jgi:outer membrane protein TolC
LDAALAYSLAHSPGLRRVSQQLAQQEGVLLEASARRRPNVGVGGSYGYTEPRQFEGFPGFPNVPLPDSNAWQVNLAVRKMVYSGGGVEARVRSARERLEAARSTMTGAINQTIFAVEKSFYDVLLTREQIKVHEEAIRVLEREGEQARVRRKAGTGSDFEVLRANVAVANARPALIRARNAYRSGQDALRTVLGATAEPTDDDATDLDVQGQLEVARVSLGLADAIRAARTRRPELLSDERIIAAAREEVEFAKAGKRPQVSLVGGYSVRKATYAGSFGETLNGFTVGAQVDWSIFDGKATEARIKQATAQTAQAVAARDELALRIDLEVRNAHRKVAEAADLLDSAQKVIEEAAESLRLAQARLAAGTANQLDVLAAQSALTEARSNLSQAQRDYAVSAAQMRQATGRRRNPISRCHAPKRRPRRGMPPVCGPSAATLPPLTRV